MTAPHNAKTVIDITPTWGGLMPVFIELLKSTDVDADAKNTVASELLKLARIVDNVATGLKQERD